MPETRYNVALLEQVRDTIADEDRHEQSIWAKISRAVLRRTPDRWADQWGNQFIEVSCPTAACVAGWAASLAGGKMIVPAYVADCESVRGSVEVNDVMVDGRQVPIQSYAQEQLGLTPREANALFAAEWSNQEVLENLDAIIHAARHGWEWEIRYANEYDDDDYDGADD